MMIFSETNIFILSKLLATLRATTGIRYKLNNQQHINQLVRAAADTDNPQIRQYFYKFLENLTPEQIAEFISAGVNVPETYIRKPGFLPTPVTRTYAYIPRMARST